MKRLIEPVLALGLFSAPAMAMDEVGDADLVPEGQWELQYEDFACHLNRTYRNGDQEVQFSFQREPLNAKNWLYLFFEGESGNRDGDDADIFIDGALAGENLHYNIFDAPGYRVRQIWIDLDQVALDQARSSLKFDLARHGSIAIAVPDFPQAWDALDSCMDDLYAHFGVGMEAQRAMAVAPQGSILKSIRWPGGAGDFALFYWVNEQGRVDECNLVMPSGKDEFDSSLCDRLIENGRFEPARDEADNPVRVAQFENIRIRTQTLKVSR